MCFAPQRRVLFRKSTSEPPKVDRTWCVLYILTWKCASRHNGVHFFESRHLSLQKWTEHGVFCTFSLRNVLRATTACTFSKVDIWASKSGPNMWCFVHVHLDMCFAPQRRALFRHRNFQKWSDIDIGVFCAFWLGHVLRATTACNFSTSQLPKVVRHWCVLYIFTWKCASRHNGVHFFDIATYKSGPSWCVLYIFTWKCASRHNGVHFLISHLASCLRTRRFSEPTFPPSGATNHWKNTGNRDFQCFTTFLPFRASASSFFWLFLFSDLLSSNLSLLSASSLLCFSCVHIVGSLASKLPSIRLSNRNACHIRSIWGIWQFYIALFIITTESPITNQSPHQRAFATPAMSIASSTNLGERPSSVARGGGTPKKIK